MKSFPFTPPKTPAKCVDAKQVQDWVAEPLRRRVDLTKALKIIKAYYCAALVGRGVCPVHCESCRDAIVSMFGLDEAENPLALFTWRAKDRSAAMIEKLIEAEKAEKFPTLETRNNSSETDPLAALFPKKQPDNLFLELMRDYE